MADTQRWLVYALGGGLGHLTRALALTRRARAHGHDVTILSNSPLARALPYERELAGARLEVIPSDWARDRVAHRVHQIMAARGFDLLVVDTFARGLGGELSAIVPALDVPRVLVHRLVCTAYVERASLRTFAGHYDAILVPGERAPLDGHARAITTAPWLIRDAGELWDRDTARRALGVAGDEPVVLVMGSGRDSEIRACAALAGRLRLALGQGASVRFAAPGHHICPWPLLPALPGVDVLIGAGGYNTVHEARATGVPLLALAQPRLYDRQAERLRPDERIASPDHALARVRALLASGTRAAHTRSRPGYENGVHAAITAIERVTHARSRGPTPDRPDGSARGSSLRG